MSPTMSLVIGIIIGSFTAMILIVIIVLKVCTGRLHNHSLINTFCSSGIVVCLFVFSLQKGEKRFVIVIVSPYIVDFLPLDSFV